MTRGMMMLVGGQNPRHDTSLTAGRSMARIAAWRTRLSCQTDFGSHWSANSIQ